MNIVKWNVLYAVFAAVAAAAFCVFPAYGWPPDMAAEGAGLEPLDNQLGALGFRVAVAPELRLFKVGRPFYSERDRCEADMFPSSLDMGGVAHGGAVLQRLQAKERDWVHSVLESASGAKAYLSRLTPALVVESDGKPLTFFSGQNAPTPQFFATAAGVIPIEKLGEAAFGEPPWLLVWFGKSTKFKSTHFPYLYNGKGWEPTEYVAVDCPLLFVFSDPLVEARFSAAGGLEIGFENIPGLAVEQNGGPKIAVLPLFGDYYPVPRLTEPWAQGLPAEVAAQCAAWTECLAEVPLSVRETYDVNEAADIVTVTEKFEFLKLREGGVRLAPLPPMLALAADYGFQMKIKAGDVFKTSALTAWGPYKGVKGVGEYAVEIPGILKYARQTRTVATQRAEPPELAQALEEQVRKVVEAGHLAPWYAAVNVYGAGYRTYLFLHGTLTWGNPGETLFALAEALPLLEEPLRAEVLAYMRKERDDYPPEGIAILRVEEGARRERWRLDEGEIREILLEHNDIIEGKTPYPANFYVSHRLIPPQNLYYLAEYARATGSTAEADLWPDIRGMLNPWLLRADWASLGWFRWPDPLGLFDGWGGAVDANNFFCALVGAARLARSAGDAEGERFALGRLALCAALRHGMGFYGNYLYDNRFAVLPTDPTLSAEEFAEQCGGRAKNLFGKPNWQALHFTGSWTGRLISYNFTSPENDVRAVVRMNEFGVYFDEVFQQYAGRGLVGYRGMVAPELGRFLSESQPQKAREYANRLAEHMPDWYVALCQTFIGAEFNYLPPEDSYSAFLAHAWILKDRPEALRRLLDVPWMERGDLYYLHKLSETIKAYRGVGWE